MDHSSSDAKKSRAQLHKSDDSGTMERSDSDMRRVLTKLQELGPKPLGTQSVEDTRNQPTPSDAVAALLVAQGQEPSELTAKLKVKKKDVTYPTGGGVQAARVYTPDLGKGAASSLPLIVYFHGGGWVIADLDTYESSAMALAHKCSAIVVSIDYRHAPEHKFPAQHEDAFNAYKWALQNAKSWGANPNSVAVAGESAGGNLAINVAIMARDQDIQRPVYMLLVYPVAGVDTNTESYQTNANAVPLGKKGMEWFVEHTIRSDRDKASPMLDLVGKANLEDLPDATVITAEIDPLLSEGLMLADKLRQAGSHVTYKSFAGVTHEFFGMDAVLDTAIAAQEVAARDLKGAFGSTVSH